MMRTLGTTPSPLIVNFELARQIASQRMISIRHLDAKPPERWMVREKLPKVR